MEGAMTAPNNSLVYVNPEEGDALCDVDIMTTFMLQHTSIYSGALYAAGGLGVRDGHLIISIVRDRVHKIFPLKSRWATCDRHKRGSVSYASSFVGFAPKSALTLAEVLTWTRTNHRIAKHALFTLDELRWYLKELERQHLEATGLPGGGIQILWDDHGMDGTLEGELHPDLPASAYGFVQVKGYDEPCCDSYSGFRDNLGRSTGLGERMKKAGVKRLFITGLASDFCVKWTALNALMEGFEVFIILDATRPVDLPGNESVAGSMTKAVYDLVAAGARFVYSHQLRLVVNP
jgi:nicotinamidase/pyrazinamidase